MRVVMVACVLRVVMVACVLRVVMVACLLRVVGAACVWSVGAMNGCLAQWHPSRPPTARFRSSLSRAC